MADSFHLLDKAYSTPCTRRPKRLGTVEHMWRWLAAEPREVVDLAGARALGGRLRREPGSPTSCGAGGGSSPAAASSCWPIAMRRRTRSRRAARDPRPARRPPAVDRRRDPARLFVASVGFFMSRGPRRSRLARLLDDKLGLNDRLATALEIEARGDGGPGSKGGPSPTRRRCSPRAGRTGAPAPPGVVASGGRCSRRWRRWPSSSRSGRPPPATPPPGRSRRSARPAPARAAVRRTNTIAPRPKSAGTKNSRPRPGNCTSSKAGKLLRRVPSTPPRAATARSPRAKRPPASEGKGTTSKAAARAANGERADRQAPQEQRRQRRRRKTRRRKKPAGTDGKQKAAGPKKRKSRKSASTSKTRKMEPTFRQRPLPRERCRPAKNRAAKTANSAANRAPRKAAGKGGTPAGAGKAGGEQGTNQQGHATPIKGKASQAVRIQPGYAPSRSTKGGQRKTQDRRLAGRGRQSAHRAG